MSDRGRRREEDLERELREMGPHVEYPPTPDMARAVRRRLEEEERPRRSFGRFLSPRWAVAAVLLLALILPLSSPEVRAFLGGLSAMSSGGGGGASQGGEGGGAGAAGSAPEEAEPEREARGSAAGGGVSEEDLPESAAGGAEAGGAEVFFPRHAGGESPAALAAGRLVVEENGCIRLETNGEAITPIWPADFSLSSTRGEGSILDGEGRVLAELGDRVEAGGGFVGRSPEGIPGLDGTTRRELRTRCPGEYFLVGSLERIP